MPFPLSLRAIHQSPYHNGPLSMEQFTRILTCGKGAFGEVLLVHWNGEKPLAPQSMFSNSKTCTYLHHMINGVLVKSEHPLSSERLFVIKCESKASFLEKNKIACNIDPFLEIKLLQSVAHPFITAYIGHFEDEANLHLVQEYVYGTDLKSLIEKKKRNNAPPFTENEALSIIFQLAMALEYLHRHSIYHRDLKSANILVSAEHQFIKLCDFGFAKRVNEVSPNLNHSISVVGTPFYMSPQVVQRKPYTDKMDCWSVGILLYELLTLTKPFSGDSTEQIGYAIVLSGFDMNLLKFHKVSQDTQDLILQLLQKEEKNRLSMKELLHSPTMKAIGGDFIGKYQDFAKEKKSSVDAIWAQVLEEQYRDVVLDMVKGSMNPTNVNKNTMSSLVHNRSMFFTRSEQSLAPIRGKLEPLHRFFLQRTRLQHDEELSRLMLERRKDEERLRLIRLKMLHEEELPPSMPNRQ